MTREKFRSHLFLLTATLLFGVNYWISKSLMPDFLNPPQIIFIRGLGAFILFLVYSFFLAKEKISLKDNLLLVLCSVFGVAINQVLFFEGLNLTSPLDAAIIHVMNPLMVLVAAAIIIKERITSLKLFGVICGLLGALILVAYGKDIQLNPAHTFGNMMILTNTFSYAIYLVLAKPLLNRYHPVTIMTRVFFFGLLFTLPYSAPHIPAIDFSAFTPYIWFAVFYLVVMVTFIAYLLTITALKHLSTATVSYYIYLQPMLVTLIALILGKELPAWHQGIAALLIFGGVYVVNRKQIKAFTAKKTA